VALEAAAAGAPLAVAATGGLAEIVEPGVTGVTFPARDEGALARSVSTLLADRPGARRMVATAKAMVRRRYGWPTVGEQTAAAYAAAVDGAPSEPYAPEELWKSRQRGIAIPEGNLLAAAGLAA
jgi:glycogen(starch) synthase